MASFEIDTYKVSAHLSRYESSSGGARTIRERTLHMVGPVLYHGIQNKATFAFSDSFNSFNSGVAGYLSGGGFDGLSLVGWFPRSEFDDYYDILRAEKPISVEYSLRESGTLFGYATRVGLNTGAEPIGEGPADTEAALAEVMMMRTAGTFGTTSILPPAELAVSLEPTTTVELAPMAKVSNAKAK